MNLLKNNKKTKINSENQCVQNPFSYLFYIYFTFLGQNPIPGPSIQMIFQALWHRPAWRLTPKIQTPRMPLPASSSSPDTARLFSASPLTQDRLNALLPRLRSITPPEGDRSEVIYIKNNIFSYFDHGF